MGCSVASAGDINGDGFADVIVGAYMYDKGYTDAGAAMVFLGGAHLGRSVLARQLDGAIDPTPVQPWGLSLADGGFLVRMNNTSPRGRERVKLELEACPSGLRFGLPGCLRWTSADWTDSTATSNGVELEVAATDLPPGLYHWRARTLYAPYTVDQPGINPPQNPIGGPWRRLLGQAFEADIRIPGRPDLGITKDDGVDSIYLGDPYTYSIVASNPGPSDVPAATVSDVFPAELSGVSWTCTGTGGGSCAAAGTGDISESVGLPAGASVTFTATAIVDPGASVPTLFNTATVVCPAGVLERSPSDNSDTDTDTLLQSMIFNDGFESGDTSAWSVTVF